jgi:AraC-like DNA-binding protein
MLEAGLRKPLPDMDYPFPVISEPITAAINDSTLKFAEIEEVKHVMEGMRQLAARLQTWYEALHKQEPEYSKDQRHVQLHKLFQRNYRSKLNLAKVAKFMHLSPSRTAHVIKEITGKNFKDVLNEYRLRDACLQLITTNLSISEIAHDIGYTDESNFYRAFKHYMKITPRQYRVTSREEQPYKA